MNLSRFHWEINQIQEEEFDDLNSFLLDKGYSNKDLLLYGKYYENWIQEKID